MEDVKLFEPLYNEQGESKQLEYINALMSGEYSFLCYGGAMGGGKTYLTVALLILLCKIYPGSRWAIIRKDLSRIRKTVLPTFKKLAPSNFCLGVFSENTSPIAKFKNGSQIEFYGENLKNDPELDWMKGLEVNGIVLEQLEEISFKCFELSFVRAGRWRLDNMPKPVVLATINPTMTWPREKIYNQWVSGGLNKKWFYLPAKISDNPILFNDKDYMSAFDNLDPDTKARWIEGDWDAFGVDKPFAYCFDENKHIKETAYNPNLPLYLTFDFGVDPMPALAVQINHWPESISIIREFSIFDGDVASLTVDIKAWISTLEGSPLIKITGDPSGRARNALSEGAANAYQTLLKHLNVREDFVEIPVPFSIANSRVLFNSVLKAIPFEVDPSCEYTIKDLKYVEVEKDSRGKIVLKKTGKNSHAQTNNEYLTHFLDCLRYLVHLEYYDFVKQN